jgi:hypothetical protein
MGYLVDVRRNGLVGFAIVGTLGRMFASSKSAHPLLRMINSMVILLRTKPFLFCVRTPVILAVLSTVLHVRIPRRDVASLIAP